MKLQILPNWFKKIGLTLFIVGSIIGGGDDFLAGFKNGHNESMYGISEKQPLNNDSLISMFVGGENTTHIFYVLSFIGMLIYMLTKEKIEDDYINKLRLESFQLTSIVTLLVSIFLFAFSKSKNPDIPLDYLITLFFWFYLITFYIKKKIDL